MFVNELCLLVSCLVALSSTIRVDWNTNKGPIVPAAPHTTSAPKRPYREPASVWEDQSDDIPNPQPYIYMLPPPSRPHPPTNNYATFDGRPWTPPAAVSDKRAPWRGYYNNNKLQKTNNRQTTVVASLAPRYIPNVGVQYLAMLPTANGHNKAGYYFQLDPAVATVHLPRHKAQGKYNAKTKKFKAYEKVKYAPVNYLLPVDDFELPTEESYRPTFNDASWLNIQQLPAERAAPQPFHRPGAAMVVEQREQPANVTAERLRTNTAAAEA